MAKYFLLAALLSISPVSFSSSLNVSGDVQAARQARSVHLCWLGLPGDAVEAVCSVKILAEQTNSYFMAIGFDGGYMGLQNVAGKHVGIFSIWDPLSNTRDFSADSDAVKHENRAKVEYAAEDINIGRFGGEGTGARALFGYDWKEGRKYTFRVTVEPKGDDRIMYTGYVDDGVEEHKIAAISCLSHGRKPKLSNLHSFVEDFWRNGLSKTLVRKAEFTGIAARNSLDGKYAYADSARFTADENTLMTINCYPVPGGAFLQTGGDTANDKVPLGRIFRFNNPPES